MKIDQNLSFFPDDGTLPVIKLEGLHEGRDNLWGKTMKAFEYVYEHYRYEKFIHTQSCIYQLACFELKFHHFSC